MATAAALRPSPPSNPTAHGTAAGLRPRLPRPRCPGAPGRLLPSQTWLSLQLRNHLGVHVGRNSSLLTSTLIPVEAVRFQGLCTIIWSVEADLLDGYTLLVTGDLAALGCWEPDIAVILIPSLQPSNILTAEIKVPYGSHFKYNYFIRDEKRPFSDILWRPGPEFSLSVPFFVSENNVILIRDSWMRSKRDLPSASFDSWLMVMDHPKDHFHYVERSHYSDAMDSQVTGAGLFQSIGEQVILRIQNGNPLQREKGKFGSFTNGVPEINGSTFSSNFSLPYQPVEEPWLVQLQVPSMREETEVTTFEPDCSDNRSVTGQDASERLVPLCEYKPSYNDEPSTLILINSSVCTMQRIAVLEEGKLVELLLEPVKNNVQCDSIYIGVVTKLVPHMGGAFVDIGASRPSFMSIKHNRKPFVYVSYSKGIGEESVIDSDDEFDEDSDTNHQDLATYDDLDENDDATDELMDGEHNDITSEFVENFDLHGSGSTTPKGDFVDYISDFGGHDGFLGERDDVNAIHVDDDYAYNISLQDDPGMDIDSEASASAHTDESCIHDIEESKWSHVRNGTKIIVQVVKEGLGTKGPTLSPYPTLRSRFWILMSRCNKIGISKKIIGAERTRLRVIAKSLQPSGFGLTVRTVAAGHSLEELLKDLNGLLSTWKAIIEHAKSATLAADEGVEGAVPVLLHRAMSKTLSVVQDYFNDKVNGLVVDSPRTYHEVTSYLQEIAPELCTRVELYDKRTPLFDEYNIEAQIDSILCKRVPLPNGGSLVIEQTEALVSVDVNGGQSMLGHGTSQEKAVLDVNLAAAKQIARELRLRDIGGIIVVDFIDMDDDVNRRLVYEEVKKAVERDRSSVRVSELSKLGLMEITRKRVRPSVSFMISEPCMCCQATGRVEALETSFSKIEHEICRLLAASEENPALGSPKSWPKFVLRVDRYMCSYLTSGKRTKLAALSSTLKVWILLKVARGFSRGKFEIVPFTDEKVHSGQNVAISRLRPTESKSYIPSTKVTLFPIKKRRSGK